MSLIKWLMCFFSAFGQPQSQQKEYHSSNLIIVHAQKDFEGAELVGSEIATLIKGSKRTTLLTSVENWQETTLVTFTPNVVEVSESGEHNLLVDNPTIVVGGYFRACLSNTIKFAFSNTKGPLTLILPMRAIYFGHKRTLYEQFVQNFEEKGFLNYLNDVALNQWGQNLTIKILGDTIIVTRQ